MKNPICKNPGCNNDITTITLTGKYNLHCSNGCRYASPRNGRQYREEPPVCYISECNNKVSWNKDKRIWNKYCCIYCGKKGRSAEVSKTKLQNKKSKQDNRQVIRCSSPNCTNIAILRKKKGTTRAYCSDICRNTGLVINQNKTFNNKYGVDRPSQNLEIFEKTQISGMKLRAYVFNTGDRVMVRGNEPKALHHLEERGYTSNKLITDLKLMPKIWYNEDNTKHRYYPDIYIPAENLIIEVKSTFTYQRQLIKNHLKRQACLDAGHNFKFMIFDNNGNLLNIENDK